MTGLGVTIILMGGCGLLGPNLACDGSMTADCEEAAALAQGAVASFTTEVNGRELTDVRVEQLDPIDPESCRRWGICEAYDYAAVVWLVYTGLRSEGIPLTVIRERPGEPMHVLSAG